MDTVFRLLGLRSAEKKPDTVLQRPQYPAQPAEFEVPFSTPYSTSGLRRRLNATLSSPAELYAEVVEEVIPPNRASQWNSVEEEDWDLFVDAPDAPDDLFPPVSQVTSDSLVLNSIQTSTPVSQSTAQSLPAPVEAVRRRKRRADTTITPPVVKRVRRKRADPIGSLLITAVLAAGLLFLLKRTPI